MTKLTVADTVDVQIIIVTLRTVVKTVVPQNLRGPIAAALKLEERHAIRTASLVVAALSTGRNFLRGSFLRIVYADDSAAFVVPPKHIATGLEVASLAVKTNQVQDGHPEVQTRRNF